MTISSRHLQPCKRCDAKPSCEVLDEALLEAIRHIEDHAAFVGCKTPNIEVTLDCSSFCPIGRRLVVRSSGHPIDGASDEGAGPAGAATEP